MEPERRRPRPGLRWTQRPRKTRTDHAKPSCRPRLGRAFEIESTVCLSNLEQLGTATVLYAGDNDDLLPGNKHCRNAEDDAQNGGDPQCIGDQGFGMDLGFMDPAAGRNWRASTMPYVRSLPIYVSPLATDVPASDAGDLWYTVVMDRPTTVVDDPAGTIELTAQAWEPSTSRACAPDAPSRPGTTRTGTATTRS